MMPYPSSPTNLMKTGMKTYAEMNTHALLNALLATFMRKLLMAWVPFGVQMAHPAE